MDDELTPVPDDYNDQIFLGGPTCRWMRPWRSVMIRNPPAVRRLIPDDHPFWEREAWLFGSHRLSEPGILVFSVEQAEMLQAINEVLAPTGAGQLRYWGPVEMAAFYPAGKLSTEELMELMGAPALVQTLLATQEAVNLAEQMGAVRALSEAAEHFRKQAVEQVEAASLNDAETAETAADTDVIPGT